MNIVMNDIPALPVEASLLRSARRLSRLAVLLAWLIPPLVVLQHLYLDAAFFPAMQHMAPMLTDVEWTFSRRLVAAAVSLLPSLAVMLALFALGRICREYAAGRLFSDTVLGGYRRLGLALVATTVVNWLHETLLSLGLALTLPPGHRFITVSVTSNDLVLVLVTAIVFMLGAVMRVAQRVQSENAEIV